jgi:undecaprenyl-diphosphatase
MDLALYLKAAILGVVEGLTEFLPISSTGHLIIAGQLLGFGGDKAKVFDLFIQSGAMLAIVWEYRARFARVLAGLPGDPVARRFAANLLVAFMPAALLGLAFGGAIKLHLFHAIPVAIAFIIGGFVILWVERRPRRATVESVDDMTWKDALKVGFAQSVALIPGTSRSGATIIGGMLFGLSRRAATEFSFFLAVPTLVAAGASISTSTARCSTRAISAPFSSVSRCRSSRLSCACAGCCVTSPAMISPCSPGTASSSASSCSSPPTRAW